MNFKFASVINVQDRTTFTGVRQITKQDDYKKSDTNLATNLISTFNCINKTELKDLDEELQGKVNFYNTEDLNTRLFLKYNSSE